MERTQILHLSWVSSGVEATGPRIEEISHVYGILGDIAELATPPYPTPRCLVNNSEVSRAWGSKLYTSTDLGPSTLLLASNWPASILTGQCPPWTSC